MNSIEVNRFPSALKAHMEQKRRLLAEVGQHRFPIEELSEETINEVVSLLRKDKGISFNRVVGEKIREKDPLLDEFITGLEKLYEFPFSARLGVEIIYQALNTEAKRQNTNLPPISLCAWEVLAEAAPDKEAAKNFFAPFLATMEAKSLRSGRRDPILRLYDEASEALNLHSLHDEIVLKNERLWSFANSFWCCLALMKLEFLRKSPEFNSAST